MKAALWLLALFALTVADPWEEPWPIDEEIEESDEPYDEEQVEVHEQKPRTRREVYDEERQELYESYPHEEHARVRRRCCDEVHRVRRSADYVRVPQQVHQYEVHESTDEQSFPSPPYEEMLAASAEHYHKIHTSPGAPPSHEYEYPAVSPQRVGVRPVPSITQFAPIRTRPGSAARPVGIIAPPTKFTRSLPIPLKYVSPQTLQPLKPIVQAFAPVPLKKSRSVVARPVQYEELPNVPPSPLSAEPGVQEPLVSAPLAESQPVSRLEGDLLGSAAGHAHQHHQQRARSHGHSAGGGHAKHTHQQKAHGSKNIKDFNSHQDTSKGSKGQKIDEHHRKEHEEATGSKKKHHDHADHKGGHEEEAHGHRGAHFDEKKGHKKGHKTKGYHNKYHKDEFHKEHKFYDDFHKSGEHHRYGKFHAKHASDESGKKKAHHVNAGHDFVEKGKKGYRNKGHLDADHKGHKSKHGHEEHHENHKNHGNKGGSEGGKEWGYSKKN